MTIEAKLAELGLTLPNPPAVAGTVCSFNGQMTHAGQVGKEQTVQAAYEAAKICALDTLANLKAAAGSLDAVKRFVMVNGFVNAVDGFTAARP